MVGAARSGIAAAELAARKGARVTLTEVRDTFDAADRLKAQGIELELGGHTAETLACVACHVTTFVTSTRATSASFDPLTLPARYTSKLDLSTAAGMSSTDRGIRALGYNRQQPMISQRVVNDTAQTLAELEQRYP